MIAIWIAAWSVSKVPRVLQRVPGPAAHPLIGNTLQLGKQPQQQLLKWAERYGEVFQLQLGFQNWVFLSSPAAMKEVLDKQSSVTSGDLHNPWYPSLSLRGCAWCC
ncbi:hypothetical protein FE257_007161 [Aspergillus nanangensis]|uniref:Uncharacterized protein n=1 Tax=Aspergillus nanangensis TaxID=2582783 RepID=A0AAD4CPY4_ASPNN|nr:hypothetical protein FE257_007161 [Aspergillus nanangensis]